MLFGLLKGGIFTGEIKDFSAKPDPNPVKNLEWRPFRRGPNPSFNPAIQRLSDEVISVLPTEIVASRAVVALTQPELDRRDEGKIAGASLGLGFLMVKLVEILISKAVINLPDLDPATRQEYLDLKVLVSKLRP